MNTVDRGGGGWRHFLRDGAGRTGRAGRYVRRSDVAIILLGSGLAIAGLFGSQVKSGAQTVLQLSPNAVKSQLLLSLPTQVSLLVLSGACIAVGAIGVALNRRISRTAGLVGAITAILLALTLWAGADQTINVVVLLGLMLTAATPLILGASSGILSERAGTINVGIEAMMLMGAFAGGVVGSLFGQYVGVVSAIIVGAVGGLVLAVFCIRYRVDQVVAGIVMNILVLALTSFLFDQVLAKNSELNTVTTFGPTPIPLLESIPLVGPVLFQQNIFVYAAFIVVAVLAFALDRTRWGLRVKAVGEHPHAADAAGIAVVRIRYQNLLLSGAVAGFAGAYLAEGYLGGFQRNITNGVGFIAIAVMIVAGWQPRNVIPVALMFGLAQSLQGELSLLGAPIASEFLLMVPYVLTIIVVAGIVGQTRAPAADGVLFIKE